MPDILITVTEDLASDSWGFVGVVKVGDIEAYRTLKAFAAPQDARKAAQDILTSVLGEFLAGAEWRQVREAKGAPPTRRDLTLGVFDTHPAVALDPPAEEAGEGTPR